MKRSVLVVVVAISLVGCGNENVVTPAEVAQNYVFAVAEGNYPGACALLEPGTRAGLAATARLSCPSLFARCLPNASTSVSHDQAQLLYANADVRVSGSRAAVRLSGPAVARAAQEVTLVNRQARWRLTSPGRAITRCVSRWERHHPRRRGRQAARG
jgi:hypothetical protein